MTHRLCIVMELCLAGEEGQVSPKLSHGSPWPVPRELPQRLLAQTLVLGCFGKSFCTALDLFGMDISQSWWTGILAIFSWGMPAAHISSLNLPPSRTVLMKGKHIRCSSCVLTLCPAGLVRSQGNPIAELQLGLYLTGLTVLWWVYKFRNVFKLE